jgi:CRP/FNR family transcriptional regulator
VKGRVRDKEESFRDLLGFSGLPPEDLQKIREVGLFREYQKGEILFCEGQKGEGFYVVQQGSLKVYKSSPEGKEIILHLCGPGDHLGHAAVFEGGSFPASAQALGICGVLFFPRQAMLNLLAREPQMALHMLGVLSLKLRELTLQVENLALKEVPGRLASYLLHLREGDPSNNVMDLPVSRVQLARVLGTTPETLSRILGEITSRGILEISRRHLVLRDVPALEYLAEQGGYPEKKE